MLGTPPAFILSQDQTLVKSVCIQFRIAWQFCSCLLFLGWHLNVCSEFLLEFSGCCLLFSYQSSLFPSQRQLIYNIISISLCQQFFYFYFKSRCHHRSLEGGCPDDKWYLTTSIQNCQCCFYYFFNSEYSDNIPISPDTDGFHAYMKIHLLQDIKNAT